MTAATVDVQTDSPAETRALAARLAEESRAGDRIALTGHLGAGKTVFAKGFAEGLGVREVVNSPSFTLMAEYAGRLRLFHQDLYRLAGAEEALAGGLLDERQQTGVTLTEWAERLPAALDPDRLTVAIEIGDGDRRRISVSGDRGREHGRYLDAAADWADRRAGA
ncbi:tRNA (adenosine(37)-N6)-threonylcarbamoyltransferase complex ATPase subunit type 1 TsaE [soil metagenome]